MSICQAGIQEKIKNYWSVRSKTYSETNLNELNSVYKEEWQKVILENAPKKPKLKILDIGTGPGFFSIILAQAGHEVFAADMTEEMIGQAKINCETLGVDVNFVICDAHELPFENNEFDLIISRNVTWNLQNPKLAFKEWKRVLNDDGKIMYFDANWYLYLFDDLEKENHYNDLKNASENGFEEEYDPVKALEMEEYAKRLPLSCEHRPVWDRFALQMCGFSDIKIIENVYENLWSTREKVLYKNKPLFLAIATK